MSNYPLSYRLSWLPRLLRPSLGGDKAGFAPSGGRWLEPAPAGTVRLAFVGDVSAVANAGAPSVDPAIRSLLASADLVVGNCESPVVETVRAPLRTRLGTHHAMSGRFLADVLEAAGIDRKRLVLSLANNHALDQGVDGFDETCAALRRLDIRAVGLAGEPVARLSVGPLSLGLAAFTLWRNGAEADFAGRVAMGADPAAWPAEGVDLLCALPHWDWEFRHFPRPETRQMARRLAEQGVGLVVGGHAHVVQPVEHVADALVCYGFGDFLGTAFPRQPWPGRIGAILVVEVGADAATRGRVAAYRLHFFLRRREGARERLVPVEAVGGTLGGKVRARLAAVFGPIL